MLCRPGSARPIDSHVARPMMMGFPMVIFLKRSRSSERCHGKSPPDPMTLFADAATMMEIFIATVSSNSDRRTNMWMRFVIEDFEIVEFVVEDAIGPAFQGKPWQRMWCALQLLICLRKVI